MKLTQANPPRIRNGLNHDNNRSAASTTRRRSRWHSGPTSTYTAGGVTHTIAEGNPTQVFLSPGVVNEATPSALASDGQSFNDCAYAQTCAAP
jgi:hypothetical protein